MESMPEGSLTTAISDNGRDLYEFGDRAIIVNERKRNLGIDEDKPLPAPHTLEIEPTLLCNARCHFCSYEADIELFKKEQRALPLASPQKRNFGLPLDKVLHVLDCVEEAGTTEGTFWSGGGDPLVWPSINRAVKYAAKSGQVSLQTNGIRLDKLLNPEDLSDIRLLTVSVYAADALLHKQVSGVNTFDRVVGNLRDAVATRDREGINSTITAKVLVDAYNYKQLPGIVRFYRELGVDSVGIRAVQDYNYGGEGQRPLSVELSKEQKDHTIRVIEENSYKDVALRAFASTLKNTLRRPPTTSNCFNAIDGHFACIDARGEVYIGNPEIGNPDFSIGNILEDDWTDIWNGDRHLEVIDKMNKMQQQDQCASELCRHVRANRGIDEYRQGKRRLPEANQVMDDLGAFL